MVAQRREPQPRINFYLASTMFRGALAERMTRSASEGAWTPDEYESIQMAASEMEARDITYTEPDPALVTELMQTLAGNTAIRNAMTAAGVDLSNPNDGFVSLRELQAVGPAVDRPFFIPEIGLFSVPAVTDSLEPAQAAVQRIQGGAIRVLPEVPMHAVHFNSQLGEQSTVESFETPTDGFFETEEFEEEWLEAALDAGTAGEILPWGVNKVNAPRAWTYGFLGQAVRVAIVDTGVGPHLDLVTPVASATFVTGSISPNDDNGHGTHIAGTILARRNGFGVIGVAPKATLLRAKVLDRTGIGTDTQVAAGIVWAANQGANIICLGLGGGFSVAVQRAIAYARSRRCLICAAAGNDYCKQVIYPARDPLCVAVGAIDPQNTRTQFSNCGRELDVTAPGINILSTALANSYRALHGTSTATAHVAGTAALVLSRVPGLNPARLQKHLERTALALGPLTQFGRGLVQADRAVTMPILSTEGTIEAPALAGNGHAAVPAPRQQPATVASRRS